MRHRARAPCRTWSSSKRGKRTTRGAGSRSRDAERLMSATSSAVTIALGCAACACGAALAQAPETSAGPAGDALAVDDEVIVQGRGSGALRSEIIRAEEVVFARF